MFAVSSTDIQKIKKSVDNLYNEKQKLEKEKSKKGAAKGKSKASLRMEGSNVSQSLRLQLCCELMEFRSYKNRQTFKRTMTYMTSCRT